MASFGWRASLLPRRTNPAMTYASSSNGLRIFAKRHRWHSNESSNSVRQFVTGPYSAIYVSCQLEVKGWVVRSGRLSRYLSGTEIIKIYIERRQRKGTYQNYPLQARKKQVGVKSIRRMFMFLWHVECLDTAGY